MSIFGPTGPGAPGPIPDYLPEFRREAAQAATRMESILKAIGQNIENPDELRKLLNELAEVLDALTQLMEDQAESFSHKEVQAFEELTSLVKEVFERPESISHEQIDKIAEDVNSFYRSVSGPR